MALPSWAASTVSVIRAPIASVRGSKSRDWAHATAHAVVGCSVQPAGTSLAMNTREASSTSLEMYAPPDADIEADDRIVVSGAAAGTYLIDGTPLVWESPTGGASHMVVPLKRWEG